MWVWGLCDVCEYMLAYEHGTPYVEVWGQAWVQVLHVVQRCIHQAN